MKTRSRILVGSAALALAASTAVAQPRGDQRGGPPPHHCPPAAAIAACAGVANGDACSFVGRDDEDLRGICYALPDGGAVCVPEGMPPPDDRGEGR